MNAYTKKPPRAVIGRVILAYLAVFSFIFLMSQLFAQTYFPNTYRGKVFYKSPQAESLCRAHAQTVANRIRDLNYQILSEGCREFGGHWTVLVEYGTTNYRTIENITTFGSSLARCESEVSQAQKFFDEAFPGKKIDMYCKPSEQYRDQFVMSFDYIRPARKYFSTLPYGPSFKTLPDCERGIVDLENQLSAIEAKKIFATCFAVQEYQNPEIYYAHQALVIHDIGKTFRAISGPTETSQAVCQTETEKLKAGLEKNGLPTVIAKCNRVTQGYLGTAVYYDETLDSLTHFMSSQVYEGLDLCQKALEEAKIKINTQAPVVYGSCLSVGSLKWSFKVWYKRPKFGAGGLNAL
jgi:hypothetical protein